MEPIDFMPYSGRNPGNDNIYVHTGDSGQGITNGVAGSLAISALILGRDCDFAPVLDPDRKSATSGASVMEFVRGASLQSLSEQMGPLEPPQAAQIDAMLKQGKAAFAAPTETKPAKVAEAATAALNSTEAKASMPPSTMEVLVDLRLPEMERWPE